MFIHSRTRAPPSPPPPPPQKSKLTSCRRVPPGETVISEGEQGSTVYILLEGKMECYVAGVKVRAPRFEAWFLFCGRGQFGRGAG